MRTRGQLAADLRDDARHFLDRPGAGVDVGRRSFAAKQVPAAEDVERQVAVAVVIAVEEATFLMPVQRVVGGIEIEDDLPRRAAWASRNRSTNRASIAAGRGRSCDSASAAGRLSSSRLSVDLPATGAQSSRRASSLPASTAIIGSWRSSSWSIRSS